MNTDRDHDENADGSNSTNRIPRDAAKLEHDARRAAREDIARRFDEAEKEVRADRRNRPTGSLTPSGRYHADGEGDEEWITTGYAINEEGAR